MSKLSIASKKFCYRQDLRYRKRCRNCWKKGSTRRSKRPLVFEAKAFGKDKKSRPSERIRVFQLNAHKENIYTEKEIIFGSR